jgi:hypothetical protein
MSLLRKNIEDKFKWADITIKEKNNTIYLERFILVKVNDLEIALFVEQFDKIQDFYSGTIEDFIKEILNDDYNNESVLYRKNNLYSCDYQSDIEITMTFDLLEQLKIFIKKLS